MSSEPIRVLHVDDDLDFVELTSTFVEREHDEIAIETETDPRNCLPILERDPRRYDCIISDFDMPHLTGLEMLEVVREEYPEFPFILFTGKGSEEIAAEAISKGVNDYMQKELGTDQYKVLANRIKQHVKTVRTEQTLRNSESKYRALVEQHIVGIYLIQDDEYTYVNPMMAEIFGYERDEFIGRESLFIVADVDKERVRENLRKRLEGEIETIRYHFTGRRNDGEEVDILVQGRAIQLNGETAIAGVMLDMDTLES